MAAIPDEEILRRRHAVESAIGTNTMEGQPPDRPTLAILRRYERGELSLEQFSAAMTAHAQSLIHSHRTFAGVS